MKILMLSWEYPPKNVGELSNHLFRLSKSLSSLGHEVRVITCGEGDAPLIEENAGVVVHRVVPYTIETDDFTKWVMHLNFAMVETGIKIINGNGRFDIIHGHDWLSAYAAKTLKYSYNIPLVCTIHATEHGRNNGIRTPMQRYISSVEWMLTYEAWKVIACSEYIIDEIHRVFNTPLDKLVIIPKEVSAEEDSEKVYDIEEYAWNKLAVCTENLYKQVSAEANGTEWEVKEVKAKKKATSARKKKEENMAAEESAADIEDKTKIKKTRKRSMSS